MFVQEERWRNAIAHGVDKDIRKDQLIDLTKPKTRADVYRWIRDGVYRISPPHTAQIPKDDGTFRTVYVNEPKDRVILNIINDLFFETMPEMIHPRCKSYQKGIGCGQVVIEISERIEAAHGAVIGWKADLSKYFDRVPIRYIDEVFDKIEAKWGKSKVVDLVRDYYHSDIYLDGDNNVCMKYQSLKQGCAVAAFLADAVLYHVDDMLSKQFGGNYTRYSDDMLFQEGDFMGAMRCLEDELAKMEMELNPKKVDYLSSKEWFKFLGFSIKGRHRSLSPGRIKTFQKEIEARTIKDRKASPKKALNAVLRYLYKGNGEFSWATQILPVINVKSDLDKLNGFAMDCVRAVATNKRKLGGLGYVASQKDGCIARGTGRHVKANRAKMERIENFFSLGCMQNAMRMSRHLYKTLVGTL